MVIILPIRMISVSDTPCDATTMTIPNQYDSMCDTWSGGFPPSTHAVSDRYRGCRLKLVRATCRFRLLEDNARHECQIRTGLGWIRHAPVQVVGVVYSKLFRAAASHNSKMNSVTVPEQPSSLLAVPAYFCGG